MSVRRAVARPDGIDDLDTAVQRFEASDLPNEIKVMLRLADACLANPAGLDNTSRRELLDRYTSAQIVEVLLKLIYFSGNKTTNALGLDAPIDPDRVSSFHYDEEGRFVVHGIGVLGKL